MAGSARPGGMSPNRRARSVRRATSPGRPAWDSPPCRKPTPSSASPIPATFVTATPRPRCRPISRWRQASTSIWRGAKAKRWEPKRAPRASTSCSEASSNLIRDPRGGRNFEYVSEDPLLTGSIAGEEIAGAQSRGLISTMKHFALNAPCKSIVRSLLRSSRTIWSASTKMMRSTDEGNRTSRKRILYAQMCRCFSVWRRNHRGH